MLTAGVAGDLLRSASSNMPASSVANFNAMFSTSVAVNILLPVGISFYTFTQIAFLVDAYRGKVAHYALPHYALFVTYFPHLIAGPILHHRDMIPQFESAEAKRPNPRLILYRPDHLRHRPVQEDRARRRHPAAGGARLQSGVAVIRSAWIGALAYTFQLYFDFSGYSDMAIGISLMFGIFLPLNFNSPYKATSIIDFWRRWHMTCRSSCATISTFRSAATAHGSLLRYVNLMITMLLGGLWHGAAWTFVIWGALHGLYLCINHAWVNYGPPIPQALRRPAGVASFLLTFLAVVVAWVFFRAESLASALSVLSTMADPGQVVFGHTEMIQSVLIAIYAATRLVRAEHASDRGLRPQEQVGRRQSSAMAGAAALLYGGAAAFAFGILGIQQHSEFIYFRF